MLPSIFHALRGKSEQILPWTHYRLLLRVSDESARNWYAREVAAQGWSSRTLDRNISTQYYFRLLVTQSEDGKHGVQQEMEQKTARFQNDKLEFL